MGLHRSVLQTNQDNKSQTMKSLPMVAIATATAVFFFLLLAIAMPVAMAIVEHTFVVSQVNMTHLCNETLVTLVNGHLPGPTIEVTEGDSVAVHVVNKSPYNITIHWHGVRQMLNCWADGVPMITQCPIKPGHNFTYRFDVAGQEGTLWWHAHVSCLRATLHGALIIRPRQGAGSYPFPKPLKETPIIIGEWWDMDLIQLERNLTDNVFNNTPSAATINGKLGDLYNCSGVMEDGYVLELEPGMTYLLRFINAALISEYYIKIAGHKFTVVAADANYVNPYTTDVIAIAPGETVDALLVADAPAGRYYMVALANQPTTVNPPFPKVVTRGMVQYKTSNNVAVDHRHSSSHEDDAPAMAPEMPDLHDMVPSFYFHGNLTSLRRRPGAPPQVPVHVDERLFVTLSIGSICRRGRQSCKRSASIESIIMAIMNNISFQLPAGVTSSSSMPLLEAHYNKHHRRRNKPATDGSMGFIHTLPDKPPRAFNFTDRALIPFGPKEARLEPTATAATARSFRHGVTVEVVFQSTAVLQSDYNPMHLHGHNVFVLAQGHGNYDAARDVARYNLVDPPVRNTVLVPSLGWTAVRFVADNPGAWYLHCHFEFHRSMGMATVFIVEDGPTVDSSLPPPPADLPKCDHGNSFTERIIHSGRN